MPPKGSKRSHPYKEGSRQSTRKKTPPARYQDENQAQEASVEEAIGNQVALEIPNDEPQPSTSQGVTHSRAVASNVQNDNAPQVSSAVPSNVQNDNLPHTSSTAPQSARSGDSVSHVAADVPITIPNAVSRDEFTQLKETMSSMKQMFTSFMASFKPNDNSNHNIQHNNQPTVPFGTPVSVPVNNPVTSQPVSQLNRDPNLPSNNPLPTNDQSANLIVNQALQEHIRSVSGGKATGKNDNDRISYQLDRKIPQSVIQDIWDDKYVDLELLVDKTDNPDLPMVMKPVNTPQLGQVLQLVKPKQPKGILDIAQWSRAFDIYISIYTRKYYNETANLLTYSHKVKELASKGGDFMRYDEEFRKARSRFGSPWEVPDLELLVDCNQAGLQNQILRVITALQKGGDPIPSTLPTNTLPLPSNPPPNTLTLPSSLPANPLPFPFDPTSLPKRNRHPPGFCYTYHNSGRCGRLNCRFSHKCYNPGCNEAHSVFTCPQSPNSGTGPVTNNTSTNISSSNP